MQGATLERLYLRHATAIQAHCSRLVGRSDAGDALQETFVRALGHSEAPLSEEHAVRSLFRISTHVCVDALRKRSVRARAQAELELLACAATPRLPDALARTALARLLARCDDRTRAIVGLHFAGGEQHTAIAQQLGTSRRTVHSQLKRFVELTADADL